MSQFQYTRDGRIQAWVDGTYTPSRYQGAIGVWFNAYHPSNVSESRVCSGKNHNDFEYMAAERAVQIIKTKGLPGHIYTDSQYVINNRDRLVAQHNIVVQQVSRSTSGIQEADKLASAAIS